MEKVLNEMGWGHLLEITEDSIVRVIRPFVWVELVVKHCPCCQHAYCQRFKKVFQCINCDFYYEISTPLITSIKNILTR